MLKLRPLYHRQAKIAPACNSIISEDGEWAAAIDRGEAAVIIEADWAIIDDAHARRAARSVGIRPRGTIGVLVEAVARGRLTIVEFELLVEEIGARPEFWISEQLCDAALETVRKSI